MYACVAKVIPQYSLHTFSIFCCTYLYFVGNKTGEEKQDGFYVEVRHPNMHIKKPHKSQDNSCSKTDNKKQQTSEPHFYVNVTDQSTSPVSETLPNTDSKVAIRSISYDQSPQQHLTESSPVSAQSMDSSVQQGKSDDTDVYPSVSEVCQEKPAQKLKPTPKPRKKKMSHIQGDVLRIFYVYLTL